MSEEQKINPQEIQDNDDQSERESQWEDASQQSQDDVLFIAEEELNLVEDEIFGQEKDEEKSDNGEEEEKKEEKPKEPDMSQQKFLYHMDSVYTVAVSPTNPNMLVSGGGDDIAVIWNILEPENPVTILEGHKDTVDTLRFNFDGKILATGSMDSTVTLWEAETGKKKCVLDGPGAEITFVDFHPKGNAIVAGSLDSTIWLWNGNNGSFVGALTGHDQGVTCGGFSPDGKAIVSGSADMTMKVWNPKSLECTHTIKGHGFHEGSISNIAFHDKNPIVASVSQDRTACISNWNTGKVLGRTEAHEDSVESIVFPKNFDVFVTGSLDKTVRVYDSNSFLLKEKFTFDSGITKVAFHEERNVLVLSTIGGALYTFDHRKSEAAMRLTGANECINDFTILKDGRIVTAGDDSRVLLFDLRAV